MIIWLPIPGLAQDVLPEANKNISYPINFGPMESKSVPKDESDNWSYDSYPPDFKGKPYPDRRPQAYFNMLWLVPVLRFLVTIEGDSITLQQEPVNVLLPVILTVAGHWWFGEKLVQEHLIYNGEKVVGDPVLLASEPLDMDGTGKKGSNSGGSAFDTSGRAEGGDSYGSGDAGSQQELQRNSNNNSDDEDQGNEEDPRGGGEFQRQQNTANRKSLQQMLIEKIEEQDEISVFCLLHYCGADPNSSFCGYLPIQAVLETENYKILELLLDHGLRLDIEPEIEHASFQPKWVVQDKWFTLLFSVLRTVPASKTAKLTYLVLMQGCSALSNIKICIMGEYGQRASPTYYRILSTERAVLGVLLTTPWDFFPNVRSLALKQVREQFGIIYFKLSTANETNGLISLRWQTLDNAFDETRTRFLSSIGMLSDFSHAGLKCLIKEVEFYFEIEESWRFLEKISMLADILLEVGSECAAKQRGSFFVLIFSKPFESLCDNERLYHARWRFWESLKNEAFDVNDWYINDVALLDYIVIHGSDFSEKVLFVLFDLGLIPIYRDNINLFSLKGSGFLFKMVKDFQGKLMQCRGLSFSCFVEITRVLNREVYFSCLELPKRIHMKTFSTVLDDFIGVPILAERKRSVLSEHFNRNPEFLIDAPIIRELEDELAGMRGYPNNSPPIGIGIGIGCGEDSYEYSVKELWEELIELCSDEDIHEEYSDACIRALELGLEYK